jgi:SAM-dependent methyltransferase
MRESEIRPADLLAEYLRLSAEDALNLIKEYPETPRRACPACGVDDPIRLFEKNGLTLGDCGACGTLYAITVLASAALDMLYRDSPSATYWAKVFFPAVAEPRRIKLFRPRAHAILAKAYALGVDPKHIIDVGAGAGIMLEELRALLPKTDLCAVEPGEALAAQCRAKGFTVAEDFADQAAKTPGWRDSADLTVSFEVIEHVADLFGYMQALKGLTRPGGLILATGLCGTGFDILTLREKSNAVSPPHHLNFLSQPGAEALMRRVGLELLAFETPGKLDLDIVANALRSDPLATADGFARYMALEAEPDTREAFQGFLAANGLSSHMWIWAKRPE